MGAKKWQKRGNYYVVVTETRENGKRYATELKPPQFSMDAARRVLDDMDAPGYVSVWVEREHQRVVGCNRRPGGTWTATNPHNGEVVTVDPLPA